MMEQSQSVLVDLNPFRGKYLMHQLVLPISQATDGIGVWRLLRLTIRQVNTTGPQKTPHTLVARFPIHIAEIIRCDVKGLKWGVGLGGTLVQKSIKHLSPAGRMHAGGRGEHPVQIEQDRVESLRRYGMRRAAHPQALCMILG